MTVLGRDYSLPNAQTRLRDRQTGNDAYGGGSLLGLPEYNAAQVGLVFGTLFSVLSAAATPTLRVKSITARRLKPTAFTGISGLLPQAGRDPVRRFSLVLTKQDLKSHLTLWKSQTDGLKPLALSP